MAFSKIVLGYDGSESSKKALKKAVELAKKLGAELYAVSVVKPPEFAAIDFIPPEEIEEYEKEELSKEQQLLKEVIEYAKEHGLEVKTAILEGDPAEEIMEYADEVGADLITVGHRGKGGLKKLLLGSTASTLVKYANQSVLVVK